MKIRGNEYEEEVCPGCGTVHLVRVEDLGKWQRCQECEK